MFVCNGGIDLFSSKIQPIETATIRAHGKLLLSAEYFVLDGALALALPTKFGQTFRFEPQATEMPLVWRSFDSLGQLWFEGTFVAPDGKCLHASDEATANRLSQIFQAIRHLTGAWPPALTGLRIDAHLDFPRHWGLGSSSTLIAALARRTGVDPFRLLDATFGGSGYDIACAFADAPILYQRRAAQANWITFPFAPPFQEHLYFVGLGAKQDSREGIARYRAQKNTANHKTLNAISALTANMLRARTLEEFDACVREHEHLVSEALALPCVADQLFSDYWGAVKSLGAWGGDFVLATSAAGYEKTARYFTDRGYPDVFRYEEMVL